MGHTIPLRRLSLDLMQAFSLVLVSWFNTLAVATTPPPPAFGNTTDHIALLSFKSLITSDPSGALDSWNSTTHFCHWAGVTCGGRRHPQRVIGLDLVNLNLIGNLSPSLGNLTFLRWLRLPNNKLSGSLPPEFGRLLRLQYLNLQSNSLTGEIPANLSRTNLRIMGISRNMIGGEIPSELGSLERLQLMSVSMNMIGGKIPSELGSLARLQVLSLTYNMITGRIPPSMGNLSSISKFYVGANRLVGSIPKELGGIAGLQELSMGSNLLSGSIPPSLYNTSSLRRLEVSGNKLSGTLPPDLGCRLPQLEEVVMHHNQLGGHLPSSFPNASRLFILELHTNNFVGVVPSNLGALQNLSRLSLAENQLEAGDWSFLSSLTNCSRLERLFLNENKLQGKMPMVIGMIANLSTQLQKFLIAGNIISGSIPSDIGKLVNLVALDMGNNQLTGAIPDAIGNLASLVVFALSSNKLSGKIPSSLGNLTRLTRLWLHANDLEGRIPTSFRNFHFLELLDLSHNKLNGEIPKEVISLRSLSEYLNLSHNSFTGPLPMEVKNLKNLAVLNISENKLFGKIPTSLGDCQVIEYLVMEGNSFLGPIPSSLTKLRGLQVMDLSRNKLSGPIPEFLQSLPYLRFLNLSFNNFEGEVPEGGLFQNYSQYSIVGNQKLCGGDPKLHLPECHLQASRRKHGTSKLTTIIVVLAVLVSCSAFFFMFTRCSQILGSRKESPPLASPSGIHYTRISYSELLKATNGFSRENLLGEGSFGSVYKGKLDESTKLIAVKVLNLQQHGASRSFMAECEVLRNIRHRNLLKILTTCSSLDFQGHDFKALVFEYMDNGSLENWLHPKEYTSSLSTKLSFLQRLNIAIDVACALDYLHNHGDIPIVHCDLKPSNILLDCNMSAHVGDFGLSRFILENVKEQFKDLTSSLGIKGSIGYIAPEYGTGSQPYTLGDVYSYGILLLEMFTGKRPTDELFQDGLNLHRYVEMAFPALVVNVIDPCLLLHDAYEGAINNIQDVKSIEQRLQKCLISIIEVGLQCSKESPKERMEMKDVVKEMIANRDVFLKLQYVEKSKRGVTSQVKATQVIALSGSMLELKA